MHGIVKGMAHLAELGYIHRDLAARNVLVSEEITGQDDTGELEVGFVPKVTSQLLSAVDKSLFHSRNVTRLQIADFGLARDTEQSDYYTAKAGAKIPIRWTAPEALQKRKFTTFSDVWAFGITCFELWADGKKPMKAWSNAIVVEQVVHNRYKMEYKHLRKYECPEDLFDQCIAPCWNYLPESRPSFNTLVARLDFFTGNRESLPVDEPLNEIAKAVRIPASGLDIKTYPKEAVNRCLEERRALPCEFCGVCLVACFC